MANDSAILDSSFLNRTSQSLYMPMDEMYRVTRGINKDWGMEHYDPPKQSFPHHKQKFAFTHAIRRTLSEVQTRIDENLPGPGKYEKEEQNPLVSKVHKPVFQAAKNSFIADIMRSQKKPGPGAYFETEKGHVSGEITDPKKCKGPVIDKSEGHNFITESQYRGQQSPGPASYSPYESKKVMFPNLSAVFHEKKFKKPPLKDASGPGYYYKKDYITNIKDQNQALPRDPIRPRVPRPVMGKGNPPTAIEIRAKQTKAVPGVGHYKDSVTPLEAFPTEPKKIHFAISRDKSGRFPETVTKLTEYTKGPGYYDLEDEDDELRKDR